MKQTFSEMMKAWYRREKEKLAGMTGRERASYIITYYWIWILGIAVAVSFLFYAVYRANFTVNNNWIYGYFVNTMEPGGKGSALWEDFAEFSGYDLSEGNIEFIARAFFDPTKPGGTNNSYYQAFVAVVEAGALDFVTMGEPGLTVIGSSGRLLDLNDERCDAIREKYEDRLVTCIPFDESYSTEPVPIGIDVSDSLLVTKYHLYEESCVLGIAAYSKHLEAVETFLEFILGEG